jgi:hypothetical protein
MPVLFSMGAAWDRNCDIGDAHEKAFEVDGLRARFAGAMAGGNGPDQHRESTAN